MTVSLNFHEKNLKQDETKTNKGELLLHTITIFNSDTLEQ